MRRLICALLVAAGCVSPVAPCVPLLGSGCRYYAVTVYEDSVAVLQVRTAVFDPCLPKEESDRRFPGWPVVADTLKACPSPRGGLRP